MFVKSVLKDSFKELKLVLKDYKLLIVTSVVLAISSYIANEMVQNKRIVLILGLLTMNLFFGVYQYSALGKLINSKNKKVMEEVSKGYWNKLFRLIGTCVVIALISAGVAILVIVGFKILLLITGGNLLFFFMMSGFRYIFDFIPIIFILVLVVRVLPSIPLSILDNTVRPVHLSLEISKGYFFRIFFINTCIPVVMLSIVVMLNVLLSFISPNKIITSLIAIPFNFINLTLTALFLINSTYYLLNKDKLLKQNKEKSFEEVYSNQ